jgi:hypothetical protein
MQIPKLGLCALHLRDYCLIVDRVSFLYYLLVRSDLDGIRQEPVHEHLELALKEPTSGTLQRFAAGSGQVPSMISPLLSGMDGSRKI